MQVQTCRRHVAMDEGNNLTHVAKEFLSIFNEQFQRAVQFDEQAQRGMHLKPLVAHLHGGRHGPRHLQETRQSVESDRTGMDVKSGVKLPPFRCQPQSVGAGRQAFLLNAFPHTCPL